MAKLISPLPAGTPGVVRVAASDVIIQQAGVGEQVWHSTLTESVPSYNWFFSRSDPVAVADDVVIVLGTNESRTCQAPGLRKTGATVWGTTVSYPCESAGWTSALCRVLIHKKLWVQAQ